MTRFCKGICCVKPLAGQQGGTRDMYNHGKKYCCICQYAAHYEGMWCQCCGQKMRTKPANKRAWNEAKEPMRISA